jgi:hypothetical protein
VKSEGSLFRGLACMSVSVSVCAILWAYKCGKDHRLTTTLGASPQLRTRLVLAEGQTILAVSETTQALRLYLGDEARGENAYESPI